MTKTKVVLKKVKQSYNRNQGYQEKIKHRYNKIKVVKKKLLKLNIVIRKKSRLLKNN